MRKVIHHLRKQPVHVRHYVAWATTLIFAVLLLSIWVYRLGLTTPEKEIQANTVDSFQPLNVLKDNVVDGYESLYGKE